MCAFVCVLCVCVRLVFMFIVCVCVRLCVRARVRARALACVGACTRFACARVCVCVRCVCVCVLVPVHRAWQLGNSTCTGLLRTRSYGSTHSAVFGRRALRTLSGLGPRRFHTTACNPKFANHGKPCVCGGAGVPNARHKTQNYTSFSGPGEPYHACCSPQFE